MLGAMVGLQPTEATIGIPPAAFRAGNQQLETGVSLQTPRSPTPK